MYGCYIKVTAPKIRITSCGYAQQEFFFIELSVYGGIAQFVYPYTVLST